MKLDRRTVLAGTAAAFAAPLLSAVPGARRRQAPGAGRFQPRIRAQDPDRQGLPRRRQVHPGARGVLIVPELVQGGLIFGLAGGRGTLMARGAPRDWSPPAFYAMGSGSVGLQIGAKVSEVVFIIKTEKGLQAILDHKFKFGAEAGVCAGGGRHRRRRRLDRRRAAPTSSPSQARRACSPARRWKAPTSIPTTTGTRSITARAPTPRRSCSTAGSPIPAPRPIRPVHGQVVSWSLAGRIHRGRDDRITAVR